MRRPLIAAILASTLLLGAYLTFRLTTGAEADEDCTLVTWKGGALRVSDVEAFRHFSQRPSSDEEAIAWATDVSVVASSRVGEKKLTVQEKVAEYSQWLDDFERGKRPEEANARVEAMKELHAKLDVQRQSVCVLRTGP